MIVGEGLIVIEILEIPVGIEAVIGEERDRGIETG
jgi:hypothetical protein